MQRWNGVLRCMPFAHSVRGSDAVGTGAGVPASNSTALVTAGELASAQIPKVQRNSKPENLFPTSIHVLVSACLKLSWTAMIPPERKVYRGLGSMVLGPEWFKSNDRGSRGPERRGAGVSIDHAGREGGS
jgi:hypothetical protein